MSRPLLLLAYGQSNADRHLSMPRLDAPLLLDERVITLTSGLGVRGRAFDPDGRLQTGRVGAFTANGRRIQPKDVPHVLPATQHEVQGTSLLHSAGAVARKLTGAPSCAIRAASKAGLRFLARPGAEGVAGVLRLADGSLSPILTGLVEDSADLARQLAEACGTGPDRCDILFLHGEADRSTPAEAYLAQFREARQEIAQRLAVHGLAARWIVTQPAGTSAKGDGNAWQSRRAILMAFADEPSLVFAGPLYPYSMIDHIHYDAVSKGLIGELCGRIIALLDAGEHWVMPMPTGWRLDGDVLRIDFATAEPLVLDPDAMTVGMQGVEARPDRAIRVVDVEAPATLAIRFCDPPTAPFRLNYAFHRNLVPVVPDGPPHHGFGGGLRTEWTQPSLLVPGRNLHKWVPGFSLLVDPSAGAGPFIP